jgi:hypothetical protein
MQLANDANVITARPVDGNDRFDASRRGLGGNRIADLGRDRQWLKDCLVELTGNIQLLCRKARCG